MTFRQSILSLAIGLSALGLVACGGDKEGEGPKVAQARPSFDDALALLPSNPIAVGTVDARAFFGSKTFGAELVKAIERYVPLGAEAGFDAARDVDRVTWASYSYQGIDVAAIVIGRFDQGKIKQVATSQRPTKSGVPLVLSSYAGRDVYTVSNIGFTLLSDTRAVVGTEGAIRRVLDRIQDDRVKRDIPAWMLATVETSGAASATAADFATQPVPAELLRQVPTPAAQNLKALRVLTNFKPSGTQIAASGTYTDEEAAKVAHHHAERAVNLSKWLALLGVKLQNIRVGIEKQDVQVELEIDDESLKTVLDSLPRWVGR